MGKRPGAIWIYRLVLVGGHSSLSHRPQAPLLKPDRLLCLYSFIQTLALRRGRLPTLRSHCTVRDSYTPPFQAHTPPVCGHWQASGCPLHPPAHPRARGQLNIASPAVAIKSHCRSGIGHCEGPWAYKERDWEAEWPRGRLLRDVELGRAWKCQGHAGACSTPVLVRGSLFFFLFF